MYYVCYHMSNFLRVKSSSLYNVNLSKNNCVFTVYLNVKSNLSGLNLSIDTPLEVNITLILILDDPFTTK